MVRLLLEFKKGLSQGHRLFTLIAGDTGCYGIDIGTSVVELLTDIFKIDGAYKLIVKEFNAQWLIKYHSELETLLTTNYDKIDYIIVPVQSASDKILRLMQRPYKIENVKRCIRNPEKQNSTIEHNHPHHGGIPRRDRRRLPEIR